MTDSSPRPRAARLRAEATPLFRRALAHPFVEGLAQGTLPAEVFGRWIVQDGIYLDTYARVLALAAADAPDRPTRARWADLLHLTLHHEVEAQRALAERFDLSPQAIDDASPGPATSAYQSFLLENARAGYDRLVAAIVPCGVGYAEIARTLAARPPSPEPRYADWVRAYDDPSFYEAVAFMEAELSRVPGDETLLTRIYLSGASHELAFWDQLMEPDLRARDDGRGPSRGASPAER